VSAALITATISSPPTDKADFGGFNICRVEAEEMRHAALRRSTQKEIARFFFGTTLLVEGSCVSDLRLGYDYAWYRSDL